MNAVSIIGVVSAFGLVCLWLLALCAEKGILPLGRIRQGVRRLPAWKKVLILIFVSVWIAFAGTKDGTNGVDLVEGETNTVTQIEGSTNDWTNVEGTNIVGQIVGEGTNGTGSVSGPLMMFLGGRPNLMQGLSTAITADDVAQMWRIGATVEGNAIVAPSANAVTNAAWLDYGGMSDTFRLLPEGWRFPFAEKTTTGLTVFENGEFRPNVKAHFFPPPFDAKLSFLPRMNWGLLPNGGESVFWHEQTPSNSLVLTWHNVLYGRDVNSPTNFQAELFADGRFDYRYPDRTVQYAPVFPFDWDGDGLENSVDPEPLVAGPDAHGTNAEWYNRVCGNVFSATEGTDGIELSPCTSDVNTNAYYFVDVVAESLAPIYFVADGDSRLGHPVVVARAGETNHVPLLIGAIYAISSSVPISVSLPVDGYAEIMQRSGMVCEVTWPLCLELVGMDNVSGCEFSLEVSPYDPGGEIVWEERFHEDMGVGNLEHGDEECLCFSTTGDHAYFRCNDHCHCGGTCKARGCYILEGMLFPFEGGTCTCGGDAVALENNDHTLILSMSVPTCLLLKNVWMSGSRSAYVSVSAENRDTVSRDVNVWVSSGLSKLDSSLTSMQCFTVPAGERVTHAFTIDGIQQSDSVDDVGVCFRFGEIFGRRSLTVVKPLLVELPSAPETGLAVLVGTSVGVNLVTAPLVDDMTVEWLTARRKHRDVYEGWSLKQRGGIRASLSMSVPGIHAISARVISGCQSNEVVYVHHVREDNVLLSGEVKGPNKIGTWNHVGVASTQLQLDIRKEALSSMGSTLYAYGSYLGARNDFMEVPEHSWKCNAFVADTVIAGGGTVPARNSFLDGVRGRNRPPLANEWADIRTSIAGWELVASEAFPEPGFVVAFPNSRGSGHVGIVDYDGWSISAREFAVARSALKMLDSRCVYRKPEGNQNENR